MALDIHLVYLHSFTRSHSKNVYFLNLKWLMKLVVDATSKDAFECRICFNQFSLAFPEIFLTFDSHSYQLGIKSLLLYQ